MGNPRLRGMLPLLMAVALALPAQAWQSASGGDVLPDAHLSEALEYVNEIHDETRLWFALHGARGLLEETGKLRDPAEWDRAIEIEEQLASEPSRDKRAAMRVARAPLLKQLRARLLALFPPLAVLDNPNDDGSKLLVVWRPTRGPLSILRRDVTLEEQRPELAHGWHEIKSGLAGDGVMIKDEELIRPGRRYAYRLVGPGGQTLAETQPFVAAGNLLNTQRVYYMLFVILICVGVLVYIQIAKSGQDLKIRKIAGLEAVDDAVGRATEMGRPIMFIPGIQDMNDIQTVAGITILSRVAKVAAERDAQLEVPTSRSLVMTAARETVHSAYLDVGRPDAYDERKIYYTTDEQFAYVAAVTGAMVREKPAACFYMGAFFAESLILAETANTAGSIQIAGTAMPAQLPFFVAACDYTLIGEEFFAASAYLSGEPQQLGSLKGQDIGKGVGLVLILLGAALATIVAVTGSHYNAIGLTFDFIKNQLLQTAG